MQNFDDIISIVLRHEGGFVDNPNDKGGPTAFGLTLKDWYAFTGSAGTRKDIQAITPVFAKRVYKKLFWDGRGFDQINSREVATALFDQCVLGGLYGGISRLQMLLVLPADGILGPNTLQKINASNGKTLAFKYIRVSVQHYTHLVERRPSQLEFLEGWINRLFSLLDFLFFDDVT